MTYTQGTFACVSGESLDDILNDPDIKRMLQQPIRPRADLETDTPELSTAEIRQQEITELEAEVARLKTDRNATPAEVRRAEERLKTLQEQSYFDEIMSRPMRLSSSRDIDTADPAPSANVQVDEPIVDTDVPPRDVEVATDALPEETVIAPITDDDRTEFARLLQSPHIARSSRNPYDNFLEDFKYATEDAPVSASYRDVLTGEYQDVEIIGHARATESSDFVLARYRTADGQVVTREVPMSSLRVSDSSGTHLLGDRDVALESNRFSNLDTEGRAGFTVNEMSRSAMTSADIASYQRLQARLDSRELTIDEMTSAIAEQDDLVRKYSPLRSHERETIEYNLDGLLSGDDLRLTPGEERAIAQIREIIDVRDSNPRALEDVALFERAEGISVESVLASRVTRRKRVVGQEIRALTGDGIDIPFANSRTWTSSAISREIGGTVGRVRLKEAVDAINNGFERRNKTIIDSEDARSITNAIRTLRSELRSKNALESPSASYLDYLELRVEQFNLNNRLGR